VCQECGKDIDHNYLSLREDEGAILDFCSVECFDEFEKKTYRFSLMKFLGVLVIMNALVQLI
jgi:hypothetical protein